MRRAMLFGIQGVAINFLDNFGSANSIMIPLEQDNKRGAVMNIVDD